MKFVLAVFIITEIILYKTPGCLPCAKAAKDLKAWGYNVKEVVNCPKYITAVPAIEWNNKFYQPKNWVQERDSIKKMLDNDN